MRKLIGIFSMFFGFSIMMYLFLMALQHLSLIDLTHQEFLFISALGGILIEIAFYFDNVISQ